jgi:monoterpene epsilon-lactone hydrolase
VPFGKLGDSQLWDGVGLPWATSFSPAVSPSAVKPKPSGYMEGADVNDPRGYPGASDSALAQFPPVLLLSGTRAPDMSPAVFAHAHFLKLGVDSSLYLMEGGQHGAYNIGENMTPEGHDALAYIARWFDQHLAK